MTTPPIGTHQTSGWPHFQSDLFFRYFDGEFWHEPTKNYDDAVHMPVTLLKPKHWRLVGSEDAA